MSSRKAKKSNKRVKKYSPKKLPVPIPVDETPSSVDDVPVSLLPENTPVRIARESVIVDEKREQEGLSEAERIPIKQDVTGLEGEIAGGAYESPQKDGEVCVPIRLTSGAVVGVPESRLEPADNGTIRAGGGDPLYDVGWDRVFGKKKRRKKGN